MAKYTLRRRKRGKKSLKKHIKKTRRNKIVKMGGHRNEGLRHYHLYIKLPYGNVKEMYEIFEKTEDGEDGSTNSATVRDIQYFVEDQGIREPFTLFWKNKKLVDPNVKLRQIVVDGEKIPLFNNTISNPIIVKLNKNIENIDEIPEHDLDHMDPNTPR
jgi:hypothetical protein